MLRRQFWFSMLHRQSFRLVICVVALTVLPSAVPAQQDGQVYYVAIPVEVQVIRGSTLLVVTGPSIGASTVQCAAGSGFQHNAVALDPGGAHAAQRTEIDIFDTYGGEVPVRPGTRFRIEQGPDPCNSQYRLWVGRVE